MVPKSGARRCLVLCIIAVYSLSGVKGQWSRRACTVGQANDALIGQTQLLGNKNISDSIWTDQVPLFRLHGPISKITAYKAHDYDGLYHEPGELKGFQFWYGPKQQPPIYKWEDGDANLVGARKPHIPGDFELQPDELIIKVELQWDIISMRYVKFWTNMGRSWDWGFPNVPGANSAVSSSPVPGAYLAAMRGFEGKPRPIAKKRYLIEVALVWALPTCRPAAAGRAAPVSMRVSRSEMRSRADLGLPSTIYQLDADSVALIPAGVEASNIVYDGMSVVKAPEDVVVLVYINETTMITMEGRRGVQPPAGWMVYIPGVTPITPQCHTCPKESPRIVEEKTVAPPARSTMATPAPSPATEPVIQEQPVQPVRQEQPVQQAQQQSSTTDSTPALEPQLGATQGCGVFCWLFG